MSAGRCAHRANRRARRTRGRRPVIVGRYVRRADLRAQLPVIVGRYVHRADLYYDLYYRSPLARALARAIRIKYKIYLPARETPPPRCWLDTEIDSRVTMQSIPVPNQ